MQQTTPQIHIKDFQPRLYQETIFATAAEKNTLVVLPTGLGKTNIFLMLASHRLAQYPKSKILLLGPTRPLIDQYADVFKRNFSLPPEAYATLTGFVPPEKRRQLWNSATVIFSTPQGLENDLVTGAISLEDVSLLGIDEAHRAVGNYSYVWICKRYTQTATFPRIVGMTASPGDNIETIQDVMVNLFVEAIEVRTEEDSDVAQYIQDVSVTYERVDLPPELRDVVAMLERLYASRIASLKKTGLLSASVQDVTKSNLLSLQAALRQTLSEEGSRQEQGPEIYKAVSLAAEAMKIQHAVELAQTQSLRSLSEYLDQIAALALKASNKAVQRIAQDPLFLLAKRRVDALRSSGFVHPKIGALIEILHRQTVKKPDFKAMVFTQYRDTGSELVETLGKKGFSCKLFVGQAKKKNTGLSQKQQKAMTDSFRNNEFNVLVSSSVGEEGLDIPAVDVVVFFEPIPSVIRKIQRSGRTGRMDEGAVVVLMAKGTRDETYHYVSKAKEQRMYRSIESLKRKLILPAHSVAPTSSAQDRSRQGASSARTQTTLLLHPQSLSDQNTNPTASSKDDPRDARSGQQRIPSQGTDAASPLIVVDGREKSNPVVKELLALGLQIRMEQLASGDYLLSKDVVVEFKTVPDFLASIIDGRLLDQARSLSQARKPLLVIEGMDEQYFERNIHPNAVLGMMATLTLSYRIPLIQTKNPKETANLFFLIARREQNPDAAIAALHHGKPATLGQMQEYIVSALPGIGPVLSVPLLSQFHTIQSMANASLDDLQGVDLIGEKKAKQIFDVFRARYQASEPQETGKKAHEQEKEK